MLVSLDVKLAIQLTGHDNAHFSHVTAHDLVR